MLNTKDFEIFLLKSELFNQRTNFKLNIKGFQSEFLTLRNYLNNIRLLSVNERDQFTNDFLLIKREILKKFRETHIKESDKIKIITILEEKIRFFEGKMKEIVKKIEIQSIKTGDLSQKIQTFNKKHKEISFNKPKSDLFRKMLKIYKFFLEKEAISSEKEPNSSNLKGFVYESSEKPSLFLEIVVENDEKNVLKKNDIEQFISLISVSLIRLVEICKTIAKILKNFIVIEHKFPAKFMKIKAGFIRFISFIEENNEKVLNFYNNVDKKNQRTLERFLDGFDLLNSFIKETHDYRSNLLSFFKEKLLFFIFFSLPLNINRRNFET